MIRLTNDIYSEKVLDKINEGIQKLFEGCKTDKEIATKFLNNDTAVVKFWKRNPETGEFEFEEEEVNLNCYEINLIGYDFDAYDLRLNFIGEDGDVLKKFSIELYKCIYESDNIEISFSRYTRVSIYRKEK